jgi:hypothetical protein
MRFTIVLFEGLLLNRVVMDGCESFQIGRDISQISMLRPCGTDAAGARAKIVDFTALPLQRSWGQTHYSLKLNRFPLGCWRSEEASHGQPIPPVWRPAKGVSANRLFHDCEHDTANPANADAFTGNAIEEAWAICSARKRI